MKTVLTALLAEARRLEAVLDGPPPGRDGEQWAALWRERREYEQFGVRHDLARWLGHAPTAAQSAVFSRTLRYMEEMGLLVRVSRWGGRRATHVRLTALGRAEAERVAQEYEAMMAEVMAGMVLHLEDDNTAVSKTPSGAGNGLDSPVPPR